MVTINPLSGALVGATGNLQKSNANIAAVIAEIAGGTQTGDVANTSLAAVLQSQLGNLQQVGGNAAQVYSLTQTAGDAITQQQAIVGQLQQLAVQANNGALNTAQRQDLNTQAQKLVQQLGQIATSTNFNGKQLLGGYSADIGHVLNSTDAGVSLNIPDLSASTLLGSSGIDLTTQAGAQVAQNTLQTAGDTLLSAQSNVGSFAQALEYTSANIESALANVAAANSQVSDTDVASASTALSQLLTQQNAQIAVEAQANNLSSSVLDLVNRPVA